MKIKVCGMKYYDNIKEVAALKPDYLGFIFYKKSQRYFDGPLPILPSSIKKIGVFVDSPIEKVLELVKDYKLDGVQLHGHESEDYCADIKKVNEIELNNALEIIKVFSMDQSFDFDKLLTYEDYCDYFLFDTKGPLPGGNGYTFNWDVLDRNPSKKDFFLSGGIGLESIGKINDFLKSEASKHCMAIDVNSKMEIKPGFKNIKVVKQFITSIKNID